jgi:hypothetical protein
MLEYLQAALEELGAAGRLKTAAQAVAAGVALEPAALVGVSAEDEAVAAGMPMAQRAGAARVMAASVSEGREEQVAGAEGGGAEEVGGKAGSPVASGHRALAEWEHVDSEELGRRRPGGGEAAGLPGGAGAAGAGGGSDPEVRRG